MQTLLAMSAVDLLFSATLNAQVDTGSITGTVKDPSGAVIGGAKVTLTNEGTGASLSTTTGPDGTYKFAPVRIGSYKLDATAEGFQTITQTHAVVNISTNIVVDFALKTGR